MEELDTFLDQGTIEQAQEEAQPEVMGQPRDEAGRFAPKGVETPQDTAEPVPPTDKLPQEDYKAIRDEREKRQAAEARAAALEAQIQQLQQPKEPPAPPPSVWDDEQAYGGHIVTTAVQQATFNAKLDMSEMMARRANPDFDEMKARFIQMAEQNPSLGQQAVADPDPWDKAYRIAKNAAKMEALGAVDVAELEAKIRAELQAEMAAQPPQAFALPASLADAQSARLTSQQASGPLTLGDILKGKS